MLNIRPIPALIDRVGGPLTVTGALTISGQVLAANGTAAAPGIAFASEPTSGFYRRQAGALGLTIGTVQQLDLQNGLIYMGSGMLLGWASTTNPSAAAHDLRLSRSAAGSLAIGMVTNGQALGFNMLTELTTIAAAATTDTTIQIPANCIVKFVTVRVTTVIPTAATFDVGIAGATTRFGTGIAVAANTTNVGKADASDSYASAISVRITPNLTPADNTGRVRVTVHYETATAPTS